MLRTILITALAATALPAFAQTQGGGDVPDTAGMTPPASSPDIVVENSPEQQRLADKAVPPVAATEGEIGFTVDNEWWNFDKDRSGGLDSAEFGLMLRKFRRFAGTGIDNPATAADANAAAFTRADLNRDGKIIREEFVALLQSPAA